MLVLASLLVAATFLVRPGFVSAEASEAPKARLKADALMREKCHSRSRVLLEGRPFFPGSLKVHFPHNSFFPEHLNDTGQLQNRQASLRRFMGIVEAPDGVEDLARRTVRGRFPFIDKAGRDAGNFQGTDKKYVAEAVGYQRTRCERVSRLTEKSATDIERLAFVVKEALSQAQETGLLVRVDLLGSSSEIHAVSIGINGQLVNIQLANARAATVLEQVVLSDMLVGLKGENKKQKIVFTISHRVPENRIASCDGQWLEAHEYFDRYVEARVSIVDSVDVPLSTDAKTIWDDAHSLGPSGTSLGFWGTVTISAGHRASVALKVNNDHDYNRIGNAKTFDSFVKVLKEFRGRDPRGNNYATFWSRQEWGGFENEYRCLFPPGSITCDPDDWSLCDRPGAVGGWPDAGRAQKQCDERALRSCPAPCYPFVGELVHPLVRSAEQLDKDVGAQEDWREGLALRREVRVLDVVGESDCSPIVSSETVFDDGLPPMGFFARGFFGDGGEKRREGARMLQELKKFLERDNTYDAVAVPVVVDLQESGEGAQSPEWKPSWRLGRGEIERLRKTVKGAVRYLWKGFDLLKANVNKIEFPEGVLKGMGDSGFVVVNKDFAKTASERESSDPAPETEAEVEDSIDYAAENVFVALRRKEKLGGAEAGMQEEDELRGDPNDVRTVYVCKIKDGRPLGAAKSFMDYQIRRAHPVFKEVEERLPSVAESLFFPEAIGDANGWATGLGPREVGINIPRGDRVPPDEMITIGSTEQGEVNIRDDGQVPIDGMIIRKYFKPPEDVAQDQSPWSYLRWSDEDARLERAREVVAAREREVGGGDGEIVLKRLFADLKSRAMEYYNGWPVFFSYSDEVYQRQAITEKGRAYVYEYVAYVAIHAALLEQRSFSVVGDELKATAQAFLPEKKTGARVTLEACWFDGARGKPGRGQCRSTVPSKENANVYSVVIPLGQQHSSNGALIWRLRYPQGQGLQESARIAQGEEKKLFKKGDDKEWRVTPAGVVLFQGSSQVGVNRAYREFLLETNIHSVGGETKDVEELLRKGMKQIEQLFPEIGRYANTGLHVSRLEKITPSREVTSGMREEYSSEYFRFTAALEENHEMCLRHGEGYLLMEISGGDSMVSIRKNKKWTGPPPRLETRVGQDGVERKEVVLEYEGVRPLEDEDYQILGKEVCQSRDDMKAAP